MGILSSLPGARLSNHDDNLMFSKLCLGISDTWPWFQERPGARVLLPPHEQRKVQDSPSHKIPSFEQRPAAFFEPQEF